jgi:hypothetical protein
MAVNGILILVGKSVLEPVIVSVLHNPDRARVEAQYNIAFGSEVEQEGWILLVFSQNIGNFGEMALWS